MSEKVEDTQENRNAAAIENICAAIENLCEASTALMNMTMILQKRLDNIEDDPIRTIWAEAELDDEEFLEDE